MKFLPGQLAYLTTDREARANLRALVKYLEFFVVLVAGVCRRLSRHRAGGRARAAFVGDGFYRTLVVMTMLGFGDIPFTSDIGRTQPCFFRARVISRRENMAV